MPNSALGERNGAMNCSKDSLPLGMDGMYSGKINEINNEIYKFLIWKILQLQGRGRSMRSIFLGETLQSRWKMYFTRSVTFVSNSNKNYVIESDFEKIIKLEFYHFIYIFISFLIIDKCNSRRILSISFTNNPFPWPIFSLMMDLCPKHVAQ